MVNSHYDVNGRTRSIMPSTGLILVTTVLNSTAGPVHIYGMNGMTSPPHSPEIERAIWKANPRLIIHPTSRNTEH
jgi:hypothetical protein